MRRAELKRELYWFRDFPTGFDSNFFGRPARRRGGKCISAALEVHRRRMERREREEREREREYTLMK